jgi:hypothetical protein
LQGMEKMTLHPCYEIHIHELSKLCHIIVVWVSNHEATHHQDAPCYWVWSLSKISVTNWMGICLSVMSSVLISSALCKAQCINGVWWSWLIICDQEFTFWTPMTAQGFKCCLLILWKESESMLAQQWFEVGQLNNPAYNLKYSTVFSDLLAKFG